MRYKRPYSASYRPHDDKAAQLVRPKPSASQKLYIAPNPPAMIHWLVFDLDHHNCLIWKDENLPAPNIIVQNPSNGKSHLYYAIAPVTHRRMVGITTEHAHDLTLAFQLLTKKKLLATSGHGRGTVYRLPGQSFPTPDQVFGESAALSNSTMSGANSGSSGPLGWSSGHSDGSSGHSQRNAEGFLNVEGLTKPLIDNLELLNEGVQQELLSQAAEAREKSRLSKDKMEAIIRTLCKGYYLTLPVLCQLLNRQPDSLRKSYLKPFAEHGYLTLAFPSTPTDPRQAYTTIDAEV